MKVSIAIKKLLPAYIAYLNNPDADHVPEFICVFLEKIMYRNWDYDTKTKCSEAVFQLFKKYFVLCPDHYNYTTMLGWFGHDDTENGGQTFKVIDGGEFPWGRDDLAEARIAMIKIILEKNPDEVLEFEEF